MQQEMNSYLEENYFFDFSSEIAQKVLMKIKGDSQELSAKEFAVKAHDYVRDSWEYYPYHFSLIEGDWKASALMQRPSGHCIEKAIIYISLLRSQGIPSRLGLAKVKNHLAVEKIIEKLGADILVPHGYVELYIEGHWVKATPAFNSALCELLQVKVLEFNGNEDSIFHEFDKSGAKAFMEYLDDYGGFDTVPLDYMFQLMNTHYPIIQQKNVQFGEVLDLANL